MAETQEATHKQLNCPICLETFASPKVLECLHTFCEKCICKHARCLKEEGTHSDMIRCPVCRNPTPAPAADQTPDEWAAKLATNAIVLSFLASTLSRKDKFVECQPCLSLGNQNLSVAYCVTCSEYLCNNCYSCHKSFKVSKDHSITVQSLPAEQYWNSSRVNMYRCSLHGNQYNYFCSNHKELCCSDCAFKDHRKCGEVLLVKDLSKSSKEGQDFKQVSEQLEAAKKMFITLLDNSLQNLEFLEHQQTEITKTIQDWTTTIKELVDRLETAALKELNQTCKQEKIKISDKSVEYKSAIAAIETSEEMLMGSRKSEDDTELFITTTKVSLQVLKYLEKYKTMENNSDIVHLEFNLDSSCKGIIQTLSSIGKLIRRVVKIPTQLSDFSFATTKMALPTIQPNSNVTFSAKIPNDVKLCKICSGVFISDEKLVLSDSANDKLKLFDSCFQFVAYLKMDGKPIYICSVDEDTVAVTVGLHIKLVSVTNTLTPLRTISVGKQCYGIASYQQNIIVDIAGDSLLTYDTSDKIINRIMSYDTLGCNDTHCISQDGQRIYYTSRNVIKTMDMKGNKLNTFKSSGLEDARGITVDKQGIIYSCGKASKTVVLIIPEGRQPGALLSQDDGLQNPCGICLNYKNDTILVFEEGSNDVKVFKIQRCYYFRYPFIS